METMAITATTTVIMETIQVVMVVDLKEIMV